MNLVKVQYEIHDVVSPEPQKKGRTRTKKQTGEPRPASTFQNELSTKTVVPVLTEARDRKITHEPEVVVFRPSTSAGPLPVRTTSARGLNSRRPTNEKPDWNVSLTVPDRDLLILEQDLIVDRYRSKHGFDDNDGTGVAQPTLADRDSRKAMKAITKEEHRDRLEHHSFGAVANDPLPFHPLLRQPSGIVAGRWKVDTRPPDEYEDWAKPAPKQNKVREAFRQEYRIRPPQLPPQDIFMQHSIASVVSSYSLAEKQTLKPKSAK
jgi:hypothetical protein